ncbi:3-hydroxyisobutyrate dehydrogenase-like beta-hydroxyacid dehydrogenase [Alkalihalobacillus xiaoxiensis]|uniref:3-hydroxyisobutyrate dehydrogenase-like beta-hydroxyacid dehydrogenase n=1 Tax=Shouchella xiaoxiensis TaxID=766895 RepID=A0ABS2SXW1_9BACI|nr:DUF1932 domain-containing protein [Shouchella xiaoxiensis]MBM7839082.1 3-hydroxyisobutyrate dehydrogenase-like beta-hydroxyacid dehydrogenase [Shouchella xiaoxiensis]
MIGFIGFGEAAYEMAKGLAQEGLTDMVAFDPLLQQPESGIEKKMKELDVSPCFEAKDVARQRKDLIVAVPAQYALNACESIKEQLTAAHLYIDVSASSPTVKKKIAQVVAEAGAESVDAAMLGPLTVNQHKVPMYSSGTGAQSFKDKMERYGMNITIVSNEAGDASSIKLLRSIYMKGTAALLVELVEASQKLNVADQVLTSIKGTMEANPFEQVVNQLVTGTAIHSKRRAIELEGSLELLTELGMNHLMTEASKAKLDYISQFELRNAFQGTRPDDWQEVVQVIAKAKQSMQKGGVNAR